MSNLSPQAQAILDAFHREVPPNYEAGGLPAALRVLINEAENFYDPCEGKTAAVRVDDILKIIEELEQF